MSLAVPAAFASPGPVPVPATPPIPAPRDAPFAGVMTVDVDATDTDRRIVRVRETLPAPAAGGDVVLLYPEWLPGTHAPEGPLDKLAGLEIRADGARVDWKRDVANPFAFHVAAPKGATKLEVSFQYLSATSDRVGPIEITSTLETLEWTSLVLYPAGVFVRDIPVDAAMTLPAGWTVATALDREGQTGSTVRFKRTSLETLVDSPVYAGRYAARIDLDPNGVAPVHLNVFADKPDELEVKPEQLARHRALVQQAYKLYGSHHYDHYDFLLGISDLTYQQGLEHHRSSEDVTGEGYFAKYDDTLAARDLLPHEYTHSWNGKFRRPADLWTPNYSVRMRNSLLWVYEGQTEYWGEVLTARSGLRTPAEERDSLAVTAAIYGDMPGARWRPMQDTTNDEIINPRRPMSWMSWQRFEDYYNVGELIWLDADTLIRERSNGRRSLDDFAKAFFGIENGSYTPVTYTFDDVVKALNAVEPYDWAGFLHARADAIGKPPLLDGLARGGYRLVYNDTPNLHQKSREAAGKFKNFAFSLGVTVGKDGLLAEVQWDSPAFKAGLSSGMTLMAVNGLPYSDETMASELKASASTKTPMELIVKTADRFRVVSVDYHGGLRYPHLERIAGAPARLDDILAARK
jgi:predicted metalloprotease with PDZ domain